MAATDQVREGRQAVVRLVAADGDRPPLAVKTYRSSATDFGFAAEVEGLRALAAVAPDVEPVAGWRAGAVEVVEADPEERRITMTVAPGVPLDSAGHLDDDALAAVGGVVTAVLRSYWARTGTILGDLTLGNVLVDDTAKVVTFIDPGAPRPVWACDQVPRDHWPASRDVGYLVYGTVVGLRPAGPPGRAWRQRLAWRLAEDLVPDGDGPGFRAEAMACADVHLDRMLEWPDRRWRRRVARDLAVWRRRRTAPPGWVR